MAPRSRNAHADAKDSKSGGALPPPSSQQPEEDLGEKAHEVGYKLPDAAARSETLSHLCQYPVVSSAITTASQYWCAGAARAPPVARAAAQRGRDTAAKAAAKAAPRAQPVLAPAAPLLHALDAAGARALRRFDSSRLGTDLAPALRRDAGRLAVEILGAARAVVYSAASMTTSSFNNFNSNHNNNGPPASPRSEETLLGDSASPAEQTGAKARVVRVANATTALLATELRIVAELWRVARNTCMAKLDEK